MISLSRKLNRWQTHVVEVLPSKYSVGSLDGALSFADLRSLTDCERPGCVGRRGSTMDGRARAGGRVGNIALLADEFLASAAPVKQDRLYGREDGSPARAISG